MSQCAYIVIYMSYCTCSIGGHGALSSERNPVHSYSETNFRLQLSLCGHHDRRPAKPAHHPATAWAGVCLCVGNRHLRKDGRKWKTYLIHFFWIHIEYIIHSLFLSLHFSISLLLSLIFFSVCLCLCSRAWNCAELLPCTWRTCYQSEKRDWLYPQVKLPCYSPPTLFLINIYCIYLCSLNIFI